MMSGQRQQTIAIVCGLLVALFAATTSAVAQGQSSTLQLAQQNNSGISGTATFTPQADGLKVDLKATGAGAGPEPAHIHEGTCAQLNPTPQFTLAPVTNGSSTTVLQTTVQALTASPHAIHMHKSADELTVYVACADITPASLPNTGQADWTTGLVSVAAGLSLAGVGLLLRRRARRPATH
jgi:LPXTG-motif cell wall-anchored protein